MGEPLKSRAFDVQYPFNLLYLGGLFPNIRFFPYQWEPKYKTKEMVDHYTAYFSLFGKTGNQTEKRIHDFLIRQEKDGFIPDEQNGVVALIWWRSRSDQPE